MRTASQRRSPALRAAVVVVLAGVAVTSAQGAGTSSRPGQSYIGATMAGVQHIVVVGKRLDRGSLQVSGPCGGKVATLPSNLTPRGLPIRSGGVKGSWRGLFGPETLVGRFSASKLRFHGTFTIRSTGSGCTYRGTFTLYRGEHRYAATNPAGESLSFVVAWQPITPFRPSLGELHEKAIRSSCSDGSQHTLGGSSDSDPGLTFDNGHNGIVVDLSPGTRRRSFAVAVSGMDTNGVPYTGKLHGVLPGLRAPNREVPLTLKATGQGENDLAEQITCTVTTTFTARRDPAWVDRLSVG